MLFNILSNDIELSLLGEIRCVCVILFCFRKLCAVINKTRSVVKNWPGFLCVYTAFPVSEGIAYDKEKKTVYRKMQIIDKL